MKTTHSVLSIGLIALVMLPASAWGQTAARLAEIGPNDFRITQMGADNDVDFDALDPAVAYNSTVGEFLVVWAGDDDVDGAFEIFGQRLDATTGDNLGEAFRISDTGKSGAPAVAYNHTDNEFLVVWTGDDKEDGAFALFGQRLDAATGEKIGVGFQVADAPAVHPAAVYNDDQNQYFVVWRGEDEIHPRAAEIYGRRLDAATGEAVGLNAIRISDMGAADNDAAFDAYHPAVAYNDTKGEYLVLWEGDDDTASNVDNAFEIFGQRLDAATGEAVGPNDFRLSDMGAADDDTAFGAHRPAVAYNDANAEYLVVWLGDDDSRTLTDNEYEIFGQRLDDAGKAVGPNDFRISVMGEAKNTAFAAASPEVTFNPVGEDYLVIWRGDHNRGALVEGEHEIYAQRIPGDLNAEAERASEGFRLSDMGSADGNAAFDAVHPTVVYGPNATYFAVWSGDDDDAATDNEHEIYGQLIEAEAPLEVQELIEVPGEFLFSSAHPNPFSRSTTFTLALKEAQHIEISVYDMLGRRVTTLYQGMVEAQQQRTFTFEAGSLPSGPYFIRAVGESFIDTQQVLLVR